MRVTLLFIGLPAGKLFLLGENLQVASAHGRLGLERPEHLLPLSQRAQTARSNKMRDPRPGAQAPTATAALLRARLRAPRTQQIQLLRPPRLPPNASGSTVGRGASCPTATAPATPARSATAPTGEPTASIGATAAPGACPCNATWNTDATSWAGTRGGRSLAGASRVYRCPAGRAKGQAYCTRHIRVRCREGIELSEPLAGDEPLCWDCCEETAGHGVLPTLCVASPRC